MSELKAETIYLQHESGENYAVEFYIKSEADKVIAELKNEIETQKRLRDMALASVPNALKVAKIIQHNKYKRCLAMARLCEEVELFGGYTSNYWMRWRNKWLKLADKFKEAK